ncbi:hypothetical protein AAMO2058_001528300 [Amorphochlora amoebiformis]
MVTPGPRASLWARSSVFFAFILSVESLDLRVGSVRSHAGLDTTQKLKDLVVGLRSGSVVCVHNLRRVSDQMDVIRIGSETKMFPFSVRGGFIKPASPRAAACPSHVISGLIECSRKKCVGRNGTDFVDCSKEKCPKDVHSAIGHGAKGLACWSCLLWQEENRRISPTQSKPWGGEACTERSTAREYAPSPGLVILSKFPLKNATARLLPSMETQRGVVSGTVVTSNSELDISCTTLDTADILTAQLVSLREEGLPIGVYKGANYSIGKKASTRVRIVLGLGGTEDALDGLRPNTSNLEGPKDEMLGDPEDTLLAEKSKGRGNVENSRKVEEVSGIVREIMAGNWISVVPSQDGYSDIVLSTPIAFHPVAQVEGVLANVSLKSANEKLSNIDNPHANANSTNRLKTGQTVGPWTANVFASEPSKEISVSSSGNVPVPSADAQAIQVKLEQQYMKNEYTNNSTNSKYKSQRPTPNQTQTASLTQTENTQIQAGIQLPTVSKPKEPSGISPNNTSKGAEDESGALLEQLDENGTSSLKLPNNSSEPLPGTQSGSQSGTQIGTQEEMPTGTQKEIQQAGTQRFRSKRGGYRSNDKDGAMHAQHVEGTQNENKKRYVAFNGGMEHLGKAHRSHGKRRQTSTDVIHSVEESLFNRSRINMSSYLFYLGIPSLVVAITVIVLANKPKRFEGSSMLPCGCGLPCGTAQNQINLEEYFFDDEGHSGESDARQLQTRKYAGADPDDDLF